MAGYSVSQRWSSILMTRIPQFASVVLTSFLLCVIPGVSAFPADEPPKATDALSQILERSGIRRGLCLASNVSHAIRLAERTELTIHVTVHPNLRLELQQEDLRWQGLLGKRVFVSQGDEDRFAFADNSVDLVFLGRLGDSNEALLEAKRVLRPSAYLVVGYDREKEIREVWGTADGDTAIINDYDVNYTIARKPEPKGLSDWPYWFGDAGNNPHSNDEVIGESHMTQWLGLPYYTTSEIVSVVAGGRVFNILGGNIAFPFSKISPNEVVARSIYNGTVLWKTQLPDNFYALRSAFAASDETFYLLDGNKCLLYDAATGQLDQELTIAEPDEMFQWMAIDGDIFVGLAGPKVRYERGKKVYEDDSGVDQGVSPRVFGHKSYGYNLKTKKLLWTHEAELPIDALATGFSGGRVNFYVQGSHLACLDASSGKKLWENRDSKLFNQTYSTTRLNYVQTRSGFCNLLCNDDYVFLDPATKRTLSAFNAKSGKLLWTQPKGTSRFDCQMMFADDKLFTNNLLAGSTVNALQPRSGDLISKHGSTRACTRITGWKGEIFSRDSYNTRATCVEGVIPASGMLYMSAYACGCNYQLLGSQTLGTDSPQLSEEAKRVGDRLEVVSTEVELGGEPSAELSDELDWPVYRGNENRSSSSLASIATEVERKSRFEPRQQNLPTAPISVGNRIFVGGSDGVVRCLRASGGLEYWRFATGGEVKAAPTFWQGSIYVGSADGLVYRIDGESGRCI